MVLQKPKLEAISPNFGNSFTYQKFDEKHRNRNTVWHYHPEIELVYVNGGTGKRQVGSNLSCYTWGTLILVGSNLPHCGFTDQLTANKRETVIQMKADFLGDEFFNIPETAKIKKLLQIQEHMRKRIETSISQICALMPRHINAVTGDGFIIKLILFVMAFQFEKTVLQ